MARWKVAVFFVLALAASKPLGAQEINLLGGYNTDTSLSDDSAFCYQLEYRQDTGDRTATSLTWLNEGHLPNDHRDGPALQLWRRARFSDDRLTVSAGAGPYLWFNTAQNGGNGADKSIHHGLGAIVSLDATWRASQHWQWLLRGNWVTASGEIDTLSINLGAGYLIGADDGAELEESGRLEACPTGEYGRDDELTLFAGEAIINSLNSGSEPAWGVEYRRVIGDNTDWTIGVMHENERRVSRRLGLVSQVWAVKPFSDGRWSIGAGAGGYLSLTDSERPNATEAETLSGLLTITASRRISDRCDARLSWNRLLTRNETDADIMLLGFGYRMK